MTWPLVWSNSCCGHPALEESAAEAARRRAKDELDLSLSHLEEIAPYRYQFTKDGVMENETCPILVAMADSTLKPDPAEVEAIRWCRWTDYLAELSAENSDHSPWSREEAQILAASDRFHTWAGAIPISLD